MGLHEPFAKFFADRGPHLAAMVAYFALLSFVPLVFLALSVVGAAGPHDASSFIVTELKRAFPETSIEQIVEVVDNIQENAATLGIVGGVFLIWSSLSLFSVLESAVNIVYGRPNRPFLHGKGIALLLLGSSLVTLFLGLLAGSFGYDLLKRFAGGIFENPFVAYGLSVLASAATIFVFLISTYYLLTNDEVTVREAMPGALLGAVVLEASFQVLPIYLRVAEEVTAVRAFTAPALLLVWLFLMANVIVFGAELNWWLARRDREEEQELEAAGLA
jgi:membrane protein